MRRYRDSILHSAGDLNAFLGCAYAVVLNRSALDDAALRAARAVDESSARLTQDVGHAHEAAYRDSLDGVVTIADSGSLEARAAATADAMRSGAAVIYQATLLAAPWHDFADFLRRVDTPSALGGWSYEAVDTKLARSAKPSHLVHSASIPISSLGWRARHRTRCTSSSATGGRRASARSSSATCSTSPRRATCRSSPTRPRPPPRSRARRATCAPGATYAAPSGRRPIT